MRGSEGEWREGTPRLAGKAGEEGREGGARVGSQGEERGWSSVDREPGLGWAGTGRGCGQGESGAASTLPPFCPALSDEGGPWEIS